MRRLYDSNSDMLEVIVRDGSGKRIDSLLINLSDIRSVKRLFWWLNNKHGVNFSKIDFSNFPTEPSEIFEREDKGILDF